MSQTPNIQILQPQPRVVNIQINQSNKVSSVNGKQGNVNINNVDIGLENVENISILSTSGYLQSEINNLNSESGLYYLNTNPSGFITGVDLKDYVLNSNTGQFVTAAQTGAFYAANNPSGFITGVDLSAYALSTNLSTTGQQLKQQINSLSGSIQSNYVAISGSTMTGNLTVPNIIINSQSQYCSGTTVKVYQYYNTGTNSLDTVFV